MSQNLRVAWRWKSENFRPSAAKQRTWRALHSGGGGRAGRRGMVGGVLYMTAGFSPNVVAMG